MDRLLRQAVHSSSQQYVLGKSDGLPVNIKYTSLYNRFNRGMYEAGVCTHHMFRVTFHSTRGQRRATFHSTRGQRRAIKPVRDMDHIVEGVKFIFTRWRDSVSAVE
jgi:hypothetical protein